MQIELDLTFLEGQALPLEIAWPIPVLPRIGACSVAHPTNWMRPGRLGESHW